jgi:integrase
MRRDLFGGVPYAQESPLVSEYLSEWLADVVEPAVAPNTYAKREHHVRVHIAPALGATRLSNLQPRQIHQLYTSLARAGETGYAISTRRDIHTTLKMALSQAVKWGVLQSNPAALVDSPRARDEDREDGDEEVRALTDDQARTLFAATEDSRWHNYYVAAVRTGLRPGEMLGLQWRDIELGTDPASLSVRRTLAKPTTGRSSSYFKSPKSRSSRRTVALHWEATGALADQKDVLAREGLPVTDEALVFPNSVGNPSNSTNLRRRHFQPALARAGLPPLTLHELRHSYASIALYEWRLPAEIVSKQLGHANVTITVNLYGHVAPGAQDSAIKALNALQRRSDKVG